MFNRMLTNGEQLEEDANRLFAQGRNNAAEVVERLRLAELETTQAIESYLAPVAADGSKPGIRLLRRAVRLLVVMLSLTLVAMVINLNLGMIVLFLTGVELFAIAYAYEVSTGVPIVQRRMALLGMLMSFALALLALVGLFV